MAQYFQRDDASYRFALMWFAALICNADLNELNEGIFPHQLFSDLFLSVIIYTKIGN